jgi:tetratricopeptide (TPR) repeat protein
MGIGNTLYAMGELAEAEEAFREAVRRNPGGASGYNNLAQVLFETGRREEALKMARKAVDLGGPLADLYRQTLEQIEAAGSRPTEH